MLLTLQVVTDAVENLRGPIEELGECLAEAQRGAGAFEGEIAACDATARLLAPLAAKVDSDLDSLDAATAAATLLAEDLEDLAIAGDVHADGLSAHLASLAPELARLDALSRDAKLTGLNATLAAARVAQASGLGSVAAESNLLAERLATATRGLAAHHLLLADVVARNRSATQAMIALASRLSATLGAARRQAEGRLEHRRRLREALAAQAAASEQARAAASRRARETREMSARSWASRQGVDALTGLLDRLRRRSAVLFNNSTVGNRRLAPRVPVRAPGALESLGDRLAVFTVELARRGCVFVPSEAGCDGSQTILLPGTMAHLMLEGIGTMPLTIVSTSELGVHARFDAVAPEALARLDRLIAQVHRDSLPAVALVQATAGAIAGVFAQALDSGELARESLFSAEYRPIPGSDPIQYTAPSLAFCARVLPAILASAKASPLGPLFVLATDRNAYAPVHHPEYSRPQRPGEPRWNDLNARDRRIYDRGLTLAGARNRDAYSLRAYVRHQLDGTSLAIQVIGAPIEVGGILWGNVQAGFPMP